MNQSPHEKLKLYYTRLRDSEALPAGAREPESSELDAVAYEQLVERFRLTETERNLLLALTLTPAGALTKALAAETLQISLVQLEDAVHAGRPLLHWGLAAVQPASPDEDSVYHLDARCNYWLKGGEEIDPEASDSLAWIETDSTDTARSDGPAYLILSGRDTKRKARTAQAVAEKRSRRLLHWNLSRSVALSGGEPNAQQYLSRIIRTIARESIWHDAILYVDELTQLQSAYPQLYEYLHTQIANAPALILSAEKPQSDLRKRYPGALQVEVPEPDYDERLQYWRESVNGAADHAELAARGGTEEELERAVDQAYQRAQLRGEQAPNKQDIYAALQSQRNDALAELAEKIPAFYKREQLIVSREIEEKLHDIGARYRQRAGVYRDWNFGQHTVTGKGVNALFVGPPGTGKTMAANILAAELGLELYRVDLSRIVNKYIGETEKNLSKIFHAAKNSDALLFFDEADALFGKRTDVKDSHDRYANQETSHLLQLVEDFEGIAILASNFETNMDEAFRRRLHQTIRFEWLDTPERLKLWKSLFPTAAPVGDDIDFEYLAEQIRDFPPAFVKNVVISAAFYARRDRTPIDMRQIFRGIKREFEKEGKFFYPEHFYEYYELTSSI